MDTSVGSLPSTSPTASPEPSPRKPRSASFAESPRSPAKPKGKGKGEGKGQGAGKGKGKPKGKGKGKKKGGAAGGGKDKKAGADPKRAAKKGARRDALDPLAFVSKSFQSGASLAGVDTVLGQVRNNLKRLDKEISIQVQNSKSLGNHIDETKDLIHTAVTTVTALKKEAAQVAGDRDVVVGRARYAGTNHMAKALDGLVHLKDLRHSMNQARYLRDNAQYALITPHLRKQQMLRPFFTKYSDIPVVEKLLTEVDEFQEELLNDILAEFRDSYGKVEGDKDMMAHLAESAQLMDAMGEHAANDLRKWYVDNKKQQLEYYCLTTSAPRPSDLPPWPKELAYLEPEPQQEDEDAIAAAEKAVETAEEAGDDIAVTVAQAEVKDAKQKALENAANAAKATAYAESQPASLDDLTDRYQWLEDEVDEYTGTYMDVFPVAWEVSEAFTKKCCDYLRSFVEGIISETNPLAGELEEFMVRTLEFEEFLSDRYAAAAALLATGGDVSGRTSSVGRTTSMGRTRSGSIRRTGSVVGRGGYQINWNGIISREVERFVDIQMGPEDEQEDESAELGRPRARSEAAGMAGGSVLVPRMPRQTAEGDRVERPMAEPWDLKGDMLKTAAFESLLLCMSPPSFDELDEDAADNIQIMVSEVMRVQLAVSRKAFKRLERHIRLPDQVKDVDLAAVHLAELQGHELEPFLHYRFLLLETHQSQDFDSDKDFCAWFDRQANVFLAGLFWKLENIADANPERRTVQLSNMDTVSVRDAYYEIQALMEEMKEILRKPDMDSELFVDVSKQLESDLECLYSQIDEALAEGAAEGEDTSQATNHVLPLAFPVNVELYTTALLTLFDQEESMWGELKEEAEEMLAVFKFWRPFLNVNDAMHHIAMVRCHFIVYMQCVNAGPDCDRAPEALIAFEGAVARLAEVAESERAAGREPSEEANRYELAVRMDILKAMESRLLNYHQCFDTDSEDATDSVRGEFDVFAAMKFVGLSGKDLAKQRADQAATFIRGSVQRFYARLSKAVDHEAAKGGEEAAAAVGDDDGPLAGMRDLADFLVEEGLLKVVLVAKQFKVYFKKSGTAAVVQLMTDFQADVTARLEPYTEVTEDVSNLLNATRGVLDTLVEMYGDAALDKFDIMSPFQRLVKRELEMQHLKFDKLVVQCMKVEDWSAINDEQCLSSSAVDIFTMLGQSLPMVMESGLLLVEENVSTLVQNVDGMIMKYAMHVLRSCGERAPIAKKKEKKREQLGQNIDNLRDKAHHKAAQAKARRDGGAASAAAGSAVLDRPDQEDQEEVKPEPSYATISTTELCVRINSLMYCLNNIKSLASRLAAELNTEAYVDPLAPEYDPTDRAAADKVPLAGSIMVLDSCIEQLVAYIGAKLVFHDLEDALMLSLYAPRPENCRIEHALGEFDEVMAELYDALPDEGTFKQVLGGIFQCFVEVMSHLLKKGGPERKYKNEDATIFVEDLEVRAPGLCPRARARSHRALTLAWRSRWSRGSSRATRTARRRAWRSTWSRRPRCRCTSSSAR